LACMTVFVYFFSILAIQYMEQVQRNRFIEWDFNTITAADYTVEFKITEGMYDNFVDNYLDPTNPLSEIAQCRLYIKEEMERRLNCLPDPQGHEHHNSNELGGRPSQPMPEHHDDHIEIAVVTFAFDNSEIIHGLGKRGGFIKKEDWELLEK